VRPAEARTVVRGSRFHAWLGPAADAGSAGIALDSRAALDPDATHHCWAYRIWSEGAIDEGAFDAGEPGGTAGRPILGALQRSGVVQAVCVVSRWFGGVRLGTGGLVRAYAEAARAAITAGRESGAVRQARPRVTLRAEFDYGQSGSVQRVVARFGARSTVSGRGERAELDLSVPSESGEAFARALVDATAGGIILSGRRLGLEPADA
jgi:putative IMPACT (imprinted ancient) family translation regulator